MWQSLARQRERKGEQSLSQREEKRESEERRVSEEERREQKTFEMK